MQGFECRKKINILSTMNMRKRKMGKEGRDEDNADDDDHYGGGGVGGRGEGE